MTLNIWLQSDANLKEHPTNNGCDFTNELNIPLDFSSGAWRVAAGEIIYGTSFWQKKRSSFSQVEVGIKNLKVHVMYDYAVITGAILKICPIGSDFPTSDDVPFGVHVRYMSGWSVRGGKVNAMNKYVEDFDAALRDNRDVYGYKIDWVPVAGP